MISMAVSDTTQVAIEKYPPRRRNSKYVIGTARTAHTMPRPNGIVKKGFTPLQREVQRRVGAETDERLLADRDHPGITREEIPHRRHDHQDEEVHQNRRTTRPGTIHGASVKNRDDNGDRAAQ